MRIKALKSFCGKISMASGEIRECSDETVLADLIRAGYVEPVEAENAATESATSEKKTVAAKTAKRGVKKDESK